MRTNLTALPLLLVLTACGGGGTSTKNGYGALDPLALDRQAALHDPVLAAHNKCVVPGATVVSFVPQGETTPQIFANTGPCATPDVKFNIAASNPHSPWFKQFELESVDLNVEYDLDTTMVFSGNEMHDANSAFAFVLSVIKLGGFSERYRQPDAQPTSTAVLTFESTDQGAPYTLDVSGTLPNGHIPDYGPFRMHVTSYWR